MLAATVSGFWVELGVKVLEPRTRETLERFVEQVADQLYDLDTLGDQSLGATLADGMMEFSMFVEAEDPAAALTAAVAAVRTAIHAADGSTQGWDSLRFGDSIVRAEQQPA